MSGSASSAMRPDFSVIPFYLHKFGGKFINTQHLRKRQAASRSMRWSVANLAPSKKNGISSPMSITKFIQTSVFFLFGAVTYVSHRLP